MFGLFFVSQGSISVATALASTDNTPISRWTGAGRSPHTRTL